MAWYDDTFKFRIPIVHSIQTTAAYDLTLTIDPTWDDFWTNIDSGGLGVRFTGANGVNTQAYKQSSWTLATRTGTFSFDAYNITTDVVKVNWMYWKQTTPADGASVLTITAAQAIYMTLGDPLTEGIVLDAIPEVPGATTPLQRVAKASDTDLVVWWRIPRGRAATPMDGRGNWEELNTILLATSGMFTGASTQYFKPTTVLVAEKNDYTYVRQQYVGGASGTNYTLRLSYTTTGYGSISDTTVSHVARAYCAVYDPTEA